MAKVAFIGLGVMGYPMAGHLAERGHEVVVFNRTNARASNWTAKFAGSSASTPANAARGADYVFMCVGNDADVRSVSCGPHGALEAMRPGSVLVDHTTTSAHLAEELAAEAERRQIMFLDAPVSGGQAGAQNAALSVMVGGDAAAFESAAPIMKSYAKSVVHMGPAGSGQRTKMVNQICIAGVVQGLAEALAFAQNAGLDGKKVLGVVSKGAAQSWQMENRGETMLAQKFDFGFAVDWMRKDLGICIEEARRNGSQLPVAALVDQFYASLQVRGHGRSDTSSLMELVAFKPA